MENCRLCGKELQNRKGLSYHVSIVHEQSFESYVLEFEYNGTRPTCACGCGGPVGFFGGNFATWVGAHYHVGRSKTVTHRTHISEKMTGRKLPAQQVENIRAGVKRSYVNDPTLVEQRRTAQLGIPKTAQHCANISKGRTEKIASGEIVINADKISITVTQMYVDGGFAWVTGKYTSPKTGRVHGFRSSWEPVLYDLLDNDVAVVTYETEFTWMAYEFEGSTHRYVPDLHVVYVDGHHELIEIKPLKLREVPKNIAKQCIAEEFCRVKEWTYRLWPDVDLSLGDIERAHITFSHKIKQ